MKINLKDLNDKIENQDYIQDLETVKYAAISKSKSKIKPYAKKMVKEVVADVQAWFISPNATGSNRSTSRYFCTWN